MSLLPELAIGLLAGATLGGLYFLWLWWALQGLADRGPPGLWFAVNLLGRLALALAGFGLLARWGGWPVLAAALGIFVVTRIVVTRRLAGPTRRLAGRP